MLPRLSVALMGFCVIAYALPSYITFPSDIDWVTRRSPHFEIVYRRGQDAFALRALSAAERAHTLIAPIFPKGPNLTYIVLADFSDSLNGYSLDIPYPHMVIFASPPEPTGALAALDDWLESVILHEYVHTLHLYPSSGVWSVLRAIFGPVVLPNGLMPTHLHEGIATHLESEFSTRGRGKAAQFKMYRRMAVEAGVWGKEFAPLDLFDGSATRWPGGVSPYFFGQELYAELWRRKGAKGIYQLTQSYSDNWPFSVDGPLEEVYGVSYATLWKQIFRRTGEITRREIVAIKNGGLSPLQYATDSRFAKWDLAFSPDGKRVAYRAATPTEGTGLEIRETKNLTRLQRLGLAAGRIDGLCWGTAGKTEWLLYLEPERADYYSVNHLYGYHLAQSRLTVLRSAIKPLNHLKLLSCSPDLKRLIVYREVAGQGTLLELGWDGSDSRKERTVHIVREWAMPTGSWATAVLAGDPSWFALRVGNATHLYRWPPQSEPVRAMETHAFVYQLKSAEKRTELFGISDIDGREELWRFDTTQATATKMGSFLGGITSFDRRGNQFLVASYRHGGYDLAWILSDTRNPARIPRPVKLSRPTPSPRRDPASPSPAGSTVSEAKDYSAWPTLYPRSWIPQFLFVPDGAQIGVWVPGFDLAQRHSYNLIGGYDTRGLPFASFDYDYRYGRRSILTTGVYFLPSYIVSTGLFQKVWGASAGVGTSVEWFPPSVSLSLLFRRIEAVGTTPQATSVGAGLGLSYSWNLKTRPLDISPTQGTRLSASFSQFFKALGSSDDYWRAEGALDQYLAAPWWDGHVFYLGARAGFTDGTFVFNSNFQGGGELTLSQGKGTYLNRGFAFGTFLARRIVNGMLEYRFPLVRVDRGVGLNPLFLRRLHAAFTADVTSYDQGPRDFRFNLKLFRNFFYSAGLELKSDWIFFYYLPTQLRLGLYRGFGPGAEPFYYTIGIEAAL